MNLKFKKTTEKKFKVLDKESGYDKKIILKTFTLPNGMTENFFIDNAKDSVQIFAITTDQEVICVRQFRAGTEQIELELPGGGLEDGEDPQGAAERELKEETTFGGEFHYLYSVNYSPYSTGKRHIFLAYNCIQKTNSKNLDPNEFLEIIKIPIEKFESLSIEGKIRGSDCLYAAAVKIKRIYRRHILKNI